MACAVWKDKGIPVCSCTISIFPTNQFLSIIKVDVRNGERRKGETYNGEFFLFYFVGDSCKMILKLFHLNTHECRLCECIF